MIGRLVTLGALATAIVGATACQSPASGEADATQAQTSARAASPRLALRPGEVAEVTLEGGKGGVELLASSPNEPDARYVVVVASTRFDASGDELPWSLSTAPAALSGARVADGCAIDAAAWQGAAVPAETPPKGSAAPVGTRKTIHAWTPKGVEDIEVEAVAAGERAVVWADVTAAHPANLDGPFAAQFLADFEKTILPRERSIFGVESDVDHDGHVQLVFTPLTHQTAVAFFTSCDIAQGTGCPTTNGGEHLWLTPPNAIAPPYNTANAIKEILAHELAHLVHYNRKVLKNGMQAKGWPDSGYMAEAVGAFAQDAIGPQSGNLYVAMAGLAQVGQFSLGDVLTDDRPYDPPRDGALRGGSYLFFRWLYDRAGGDTALATGAIEGKGGPALVRALLDDRQSVARALPRVVHAPIEDIGTDFFTALAMSNRDAAGGPAPTNRCFAYAPTETDPVTGKPRGANLYARFHGQQMSGVATTEERSGKVRAGGARYLTIAPDAPGAPLRLGIEVDPRSAPRVRVGRIR